MSYRALPKIDLHRHLEGSVRFDTFRELAREVGIDLPARELRRRTSMKGERPGFLRFLSKFELYRGLYPSREWIERVAFEAVEDAKEDGVTYLELRFSPAHFARRAGLPGEGVAEGVARAARRVKGIEVRFIATFARDFSLQVNGPTFRAVEGTSVFCGLDIAGDESKSAIPFLRHFRRWDLPATIHAGEGDGARNVREAIEKFGARRIGHGVRVLEDPGVVDLARRSGVAFEVCLTSEIQTGVAPSWRRHPAVRMAATGLQVTLNTDDPSISGVTLSGEFGRASRLGLTPGACVVEAASAAFLPEREKARLLRKVEGAWGLRKASGNRH